MKKTTKLNLYRLSKDQKVEYLDFDRDGYELEFRDDSIKFYVQRNKTKPASWEKYFTEHLDSKKGRILNSTSSFIFLYIHKERGYILTGGFGFSKIQDIVDDEFGIEIALRLIEEEKISAINQKSMKGTTRQIYRAVAGYNPNFDRENFNRILNSIQGKCKFENRSFSISGKSSLSIRTERALESLPAIIDELEEIERKTPKIVFPKSYKQVNSQETLSELNKLLFALVQAYWNDNEDRDRLYVEFQEPLIQSKCDTFIIKYGWKSKEIDEFDLDIVKVALKECGVSNFESIEDLSKIKIIGKDDAGFEYFEEKNFLNALVCEISLHDNDYIKVGKKWYKILDEIKEYLDEELTKVAIEKNLLPDWNTADHKDEGEYNKYASKVMGCECLDADLVHLKNRSKIEVCDLFDKTNKVFYHVKKTWGSKSSYLFLQGTTSLEFLVNSKEFRQKCKIKWPKLFPRKIIKGKIIYGIADRKAIADNFPHNLTFFAKLNLVKAISDIISFGFEVSLSPIKLDN